MSFKQDLYATDSAPILALSQFFYGRTPASAAIYGNQYGFIQKQEAFGAEFGVADKELFGFETLGKTLGETTEGQAKLTGGSNAEFVRKSYLDILGREPSDAQVAHFVTQIDYFQDLYDNDPNASQTTLDFGARGAIAGQIMGFAISEGGNAYATGVANVLALANANNGVIEFGKPLADYAPPSEPVPPPPTTGGGGGGGPTTPADTIVKAFDASLMASSTNGAGNIQAGTGIPNDHFQTTTNQTKGIELGLQVVQRGGPTIYGVTEVKDGIAHIEALAGADPNAGNRAALGITFSVNTGINDALTGPYKTKLYIDLDPTSAVNFEVFNAYKDGKVTSANVAQDVFNYAFLSTPQPSPLPGEYTIMLETTDALGTVLANQTIVVEMVAPPAPLPPVI